MKSLALKKSSGKRLKFSQWSKKMAVKKVEPGSKNEPGSVFREPTEETTKNERSLERPSSPKRGNYFGKNNAIKRGDSLHNDDPNTFANAIGSILLMAQFFGLLPISGICSSSPKKFKFRKTSPRNSMTYFVILGTFMISMVCMVHMVQTFNTSSFQVHGGIADATVGAVFYGNSLFGTILFLSLSPRWISLQHDWRAMEQYLDRSKNERPKLKWKFSLITASIFVPALVEHILSVISNTPPDVWGNATFEQFLEIYTIKSHSFLMKHVQYNFTLGLFIFILSRIATFTWNFTDLFIMLVSTGLAERYKQLNQRIANNLTGQFSPTEWKEFREYYAILSTMVKKVDREISSIIFLSFVNNLYFICLQLLNGLSLSDDGRIISTIYFFGSFAFLIGRTVSVILLAARVNDQSKIVLPFLYNCPPTAYTSEAQRLQVQLTTDEVALTGLRFFSITRNFMLAVAGAIVTYEVVLLQFNLALKK